MAEAWMLLQCLEASDNLLEVVAWVVVFPTHVIPSDCHDPYAEVKRLRSSTGLREIILSYLPVLSPIQCLLNYLAPYF